MDALLGLIELNQVPDYTNIFVYFVFCFVFLIVTIAILTARDAYMRLGKKYWAVFWFFAVLIMNFLGLILYLLVRPDDYIIPTPYGQPTGGVEIPVANFTGKNGEVLLGIQIKVNSMELADHVKNMHVDVDWETEKLTDSQLNSLKKSEKTQQTPTIITTTDKKTGAISRLKMMVTKVKEDYKKKSQNSGNAGTDSIAEVKVEAKTESSSASEKKEEKVNTPQNNDSKNAEEKKDEGNSNNKHKNNKNKNKRNRNN